MDDLKFGDLIGEDEHGNKYYQNKMYFLGNYFQTNLSYYTADY